MKLSENAKLLMIGDSITDAGRRRPIGQGDGALGDGYVSLVDAFLTATYPQLKIQTTNMGCGGNTVRDLAGRWRTDVLDLRSDWLSIMIGINDVWRSFDRPNEPDQAVPLPEFTQTLEDLVTRTLPTLPGGLILMTPYFIEPDTGNAMRAKMDIYGAAVKELAQRAHVPCVDTQAAFDIALKSLPPQALAGDKIHPGLAGHMIIARGFLNAIDYGWG